jgi:hypothetical protein
VFVAELVVAKFVETAAEQNSFDEEAWMDEDPMRHRFVLGGYYCCCNYFFYIQLGHHQGYSLHLLMSKIRTIQEEKGVGCIYTPKYLPFGRGGA